MRPRPGALLALVLLTAPAFGQYPPDRPSLVLDTGGHSAPVTQVLFSRDSSQLVTTSLDKTVRIWDVADGRLQRVLRLPIGPGREGEILAAALSPGGKTLAVAGYGFMQGDKLSSPVYLIDLATGRVTDALAGVSPVQALAYAPTGTMLAGGSRSGRLNVWDVATGKRLRTVVAHKGGVTGLAFAPDGKRLVSVGKDVVARLWSVDQDKALAELKAAGMAVRDVVAWSPDGQRIAAGVGELNSPSGARYFGLWDGNGKFVRKVSHSAGRPMELAALSFTPDDKHILATASDSWKSSAVLYDVATGKEWKTLVHDNHRQAEVPQGAAAVSLNGRWAAVAGDRHHRTHLYTVAPARKARTVGGKGRQITAVGWVRTSGGPYELAWGTGLRDDAEPIPEGAYQHRFRVADLDLGSAPADPVSRQRYRMDAVTLHWNKEEVEVKRTGKATVVLKSPGGADDYVVQSGYTLLTPERAAVAKNGGGFYLFDTTSGKRLRALHGHNGKLLHVAPSPDRKYLLTGGEDQVLRVWGPDQGAPLLSLFVTGRDWVAWTPEGYYAASPGGERLMGWAVNSVLGYAVTFHPAQRFRNQLYRPDVIKLVLEKGSVAAALSATGVRAQHVEKILPPRVALRLKQDGAKIEAEAVADAAAKGQGVTELCLLVDGRPARLAGAKIAVEKFAPARETGAKATWVVTLEPGPHRLSVRAHAPSSYSVSDEIPVEVSSPAPQVSRARRGMLYYVGVGVNRFRHHPELQLTGAVADVRALEGCLRKECADHFTAVRATVLPDDQATREAVLKALEELQGKLKPSDVVVVQYSSHGEVGPDGGLYLLAHDSRRDDLKASAVPGEALRERLGQYACPVLLILDACHAGKFPLLRPATDPLSRVLADDSCGVAVLAAALAHQKAEDRPDGGVFTHALVAGLSGRARPTEPGRPLYVHNLFSYVYDEVTRETSNRQAPLYLPSGSVPPIALKSN